MTLEQKFDELLPCEGVTTGNTPADCVKIAEEFAISFARYVSGHPKIFNNGASMEQVLSLFKIENNL